MSTSTQSLLGLASLADAREETMNGLTATSSDSHKDKGSRKSKNNQSKSKGTGKTSKNRSSKLSIQSVTVGAIVVLPQLGVDVDGRFPTPDMSSIQRLKVQGMAVIDYRLGYTFDTEMSSMEVSGKIYDALPHFAEQQSDHPGYAICAKSGRNVLVIPESTYPDGEQIVVNVRNKNRSNFRDNVLFLCALKPIEDKYLLRLPGKSKEVPEHESSVPAADHADYIESGDDDSADEAPQEQRPTRHASKKEHSYLYDVFDISMDLDIQDAKDQSDEEDIPSRPITPGLLDIVNQQPIPYIDIEYVNQFKLHFGHNVNELPKQYLF
ncbi:hypothetical protein C8J56DRAFT_1167584 [Mycena floridula]|nr:hypothetical protein C8J56DRAFT_1167584 [Mycena floridula]